MHKFLEFGFENCGRMFLVFLAAEDSNEDESCHQFDLQCFQIAQRFASSAVVHPTPPPIIPDPITKDINTTKIPNTITTKVQRSEPRSIPLFGMGCFTMGYIFTTSSSTKFSSRAKLYSLLFSISCPQKGYSSARKPCVPTILVVMSLFLLS